MEGRDAEIPLGIPVHGRRGGTLSNLYFLFPRVFIISTLLPHQVFTCGHGRGGRLGHGNEQPQLTPRRVKDLPGGQLCSDAALGVDHSVFLTESGVVLSCGSNVYHQLGQNSTQEEATLPAPVYLGKQVHHFKLCRVSRRNFLMSSRWNYMYLSKALFPSCNRTRV